MKKETAKAESWEDGGPLGDAEKHMVPAGKAEEARLDESLGLQMISIRLDKSLVEDFKFIAAEAGIGYQPLMRKMLKRFADAEMRKLVREMAEDIAKLEASAASIEEPRQSA